MADGIAIASTSHAPAPHGSLPLMVNSGSIIPDAVWSMMDISDYRVISNVREKQKMTNILNYFLEHSKDGDFDEALLGLRHTLNSFGTPSLGSNRLEQMYKFVTIQRQIGSLEKQKKAYFNIQDKVEENGIPATR